VLVDLLRISNELVQDPALRKRLLSGLGNLSTGDQVSEAAKDVLGSLVDLVARLPVAVDDRDIEGDVASTSGTANKGPYSGIP
jgi:hypothetical protein